MFFLDHPANNVNFDYNLENIKMEFTNDEQDRDEDNFLTHWDLRKDNKGKSKNHAGESL